MRYKERFNIEQDCTRYLCIYLYYTCVFLCVCVCVCVFVYVCVCVCELYRPRYMHKEAEPMQPTHTATEPTSVPHLHTHSSYILFYLNTSADVDNVANCLREVR